MCGQAGPGERGSGRGACGCFGSDPDKCQKNDHNIDWTEFALCKMSSYRRSKPPGGFKAYVDFVEFEEVRESLVSCGHIRVTLPGQP